MEEASERREEEDEKKYVGNGTLRREGGGGDDTKSRCFWGIFFPWFVGVYSGKRTLFFFFFSKPAKQASEIDFFLRLCFLWHLKILKINHTSTSIFNLLQ